MRIEDFIRQMRFHILSFGLTLFHTSQKPPQASVKTFFANLFQKFAISVTIQMRYFKIHIKTGLWKQELIKSKTLLLSNIYISNCIGWVACVVLGGNCTQIHLRRTITTFQMLCNKIGLLVRFGHPIAQNYITFFDAHGWIYSANVFPSPIIMSFNSFSYKSKTIFLLYFFLILVSDAILQNAHKKRVIETYWSNQKPFAIKHFHCYFYWLSGMWSFDRTILTCAIPWGCLVGHVLLI